MHHLADDFVGQGGQGMVLPLNPADLRPDWAVFQPQRAKLRIESGAAQVQSVKGIVGI